MNTAAEARTLGFILVIALAVSCSTAPTPVPAVPPGKADLDQLGTLASEDPEAVFEKLEAWYFEGLLTGETEKSKASQLAETAADSLASKLSESLVKGTWKEAKKNLFSLSAISGLSGQTFSAAASHAARAIPAGLAARISLDLAKEYRAKGFYAPALAALFDAFGEGGGSLIDAAEASEWLAWARKSGGLLNTARLAALTGEAAQNSVLAASIKDEVSGVVTVYVDKGLKIENGVGYPDRVLGTAFQIDPEGYYLTNYHVIQSEVDPEYEGYSRLSIRPSSKPEARIPAKVIGWNRALDLALIKSSEKAGYTFALEGGGEIEKGSKVYAIGSPVGLENSVSSGIVSSQGRRILTWGEALQIDVPVNPGNSGGPLVTEEGRLAGIVFAGLANYQGLNFALPSPWIASMAPKLFDGGEVATVSLGLAVVKNLDDTLSITYVPPGTPCFRTGDRILSLDGQDVKTLNAIQMHLASTPLGSLSLVGIERDGLKLSILRRTQALDVSGYKKVAKSDSLENLFSGAAGIMLEHVEGPRGNGGTYKVIKAWPGMAGDESGISEGDTLVILRSSIDQKGGILSFDVMVKAPSKGYLDRGMRITLSMEADNFI